jgi:hypothetical protein
MEYGNWTCLAVSNGPGILPDEVQMMLQLAACGLNYRGEESMLIENELLAGQLSTEWKPYSLGSRSGFLFRALVDYDRWNDCQVNFLVRKDVLEADPALLERLFCEGAFTARHGEGRLPVEDLYRFFRYPKPREIPG